jgi:hypothetical protein
VLGQGMPKMFELVESENKNSLIDFFRSQK